MTIECYNDKCPFHSVHQEPDEGPYCYEVECHFPPVEVQIKKRVFKDETHVENNLSIFHWS